MIVSRLAQLNVLRTVFGESITQHKALQTFTRNATHYRSGALKPRPETVPLRLFGVVCVVVPGLLVGAMISKHFAAFLEENDLFVVSDDDDDDDD